MTERIEGKILYIDTAGWGFISSKAIEFTRIFFHWRALQQDTLHFKKLKKGMKVEFTPTKIEGKGYRALNIKVIEDEKRDSEGTTEQIGTD